MAVTLDHTIVPAHDKDREARFFAHVLGLGPVGAFGPFAVLEVNPSLTFDFAERDRFESHHYAFRVTPDEFDAILDRVIDAGVVYSSDPFQKELARIYDRDGDRGFYFQDPEGHVLEVITHE